MATECNCEAMAPVGFLASGYHQDGDTWTCPGCRRRYVHVCDEAEGCSWEPVDA